MNNERKDSIFEILKKIDEDAYKRGFEDGKKAATETTTIKWKRKENGILGETTWWTCEKCGAKYSSIYETRTGEKCRNCKRLVTEVCEG